MGGGNGGGMGGGNGGGMGGGNGGGMGGGNGGGMGGGNVGGMGGGNGGGMGGGEGGGQVGGGGMGGGMGGGGSVGGNIGGGIGGGGGMGGGGSIGGGTSGGMVGGGQGGGTNGGAGMHVCLDLGFLIDGSMSVGGEMNFKQIINFVWNVVQSFQVSAHFTRVGLAIFSLEAFVIFNFHTYYDKNNILDALNNVQYPGTDGPGTYIGRGLHVAKEYLFEASGRPRVPHALIVVAAGRSLDDVITPSLSLRRMGVDIYTVGVGKFYTKLQMHAMASFPHSEHVFGAWYPQLGFYAQNVVTKILKGHHDLCDYCPEEFHSEAFRRHHGISGNSTKTPPPQGQIDNDAPISLASDSTQKDYTKDEFNDEYKGPDVFDLEPKLQPFSNMERNSTLDDDSFHDDALSSNDDVVGYHDNIDDDPSDSHRRHHKKAKSKKLESEFNWKSLEKELDFDCKDYSDECGQYASQGFCSEYAPNTGIGTISMMCRRSCGSCDGESDTHGDETFEDRSLDQSDDDEHQQDRSLDQSDDDEHQQDRSLDQSDDDEHQQDRSPDQSDDDEHQQDRSLDQSDDDEHQQDRSLDQSDDDEHQRDRSLDQSDDDEHQQDRSLDQSDDDEHQRDRSLDQSDDDEHQQDTCLQSPREKH
ncbi:predicted protein [Nematostella vectensis]|uniref:VWFA domain-containing protein n=1 Tax=Nematostella vectensis TaxID=45351 RepID=A7SV31_NEMVE|nr:predicted protein [Nematostella vectensis]|eukprot:XP_001624544.1 predicted protein [Nematostella vectensis]